MNEKYNYFKEFIEYHNLTMKEVSDEFHIPYRTVQNWAGGVSSPPKYVIDMMYRIYAGMSELIVTNELLKKYDEGLDRASDLLHDQRILEATSLIDNL